MTKQIFKHIRPATMPILPRSPTASAVPLGSCELWPFRTHQPNGNGSHHWESNGISNNLQDAPKNPAHLSLDTVSTIKLWLLPIFGNTISMVDVGFVNQNSGFINQRFDNQGSTTKVRQLKTAVSSTKVRQPKSRIRQPRSSSTKRLDPSTKNGGFINQGSSTKVRQPRFVNQKVGFVNQGFVNQKVGFVNQKRRIHQPRFVNQKHGFVNQGFVNQKVGFRQPKTADSSTKFRQPKQRIRQPVHFP